MKVDKIIKNAKIFTSDKDNILASALVVKDGKFVYVGDENGLSEYEGTTEDLNGKFILPGIIDSHVHVTMRPARMRTIWYSIPTCSRRSMMASATSCRQKYIMPGRKWIEL